MEESRKQEIRDALRDARSRDKNKNKIVGKTKNEIILLELLRKLKRGNRK